jgi:hemoglobin
MCRSVAQSIYERYGGFPVVRKIVSDFYEQVLDSPVLAHHFENINMPRLMDHQTRFISFLMGGPAPPYNDEHLERVHARMSITLEEFDEMVSVLTETLEDHGIGADDTARVKRELRKREPVIVTARASSAQDGASP